MTKTFDRDAIALAVGLSATLVAGLARALQRRGALDESDIIAWVDETAPDSGDPITSELRFALRSALGLPNDLDG